MKQLEIRTYKREEIAEILKLNCKSSNFSKDAKRKLTLWGYSFEVIKKNYNITRVPTTDVEKLSEILYRVCGMDVRSDVNNYILVLYLLSTSKEFISMPYKERVKYISKNFDKSIAEATLKNYMKKFEDKNILYKDTNNFTVWKTEDNIRTIITGNYELEKEYEEYKNYKNKKLNEFFKNNTLKEFNNDRSLYYRKAWRYANDKTYEKYSVAYYKCNSMILNAVVLGKEFFELIERVVSKDVEYVYCIKQWIEERPIF